MVLRGFVLYCILESHWPEQVRVSHLALPSQTKGQRLLGASHPSAATQFRITNTLQRIRNITRNLHLTKMAQLEIDELNIIFQYLGPEDIKNVCLVNR